VKVQASLGLRRIHDEHLRNFRSALSEAPALNLLALAGSIGLFDLIFDVSGDESVYLIHLKSRTPSERTWQAVPVGLELVEELTLLNALIGRPLLKLRERFKKGVSNDLAVPLPVQRHSFSVVDAYAP